MAIQWDKATRDNYKSSAQLVISVLIGAIVSPSCTCKSVLKLRDSPTYTSSLFK